MPIGVTDSVYNAMNNIYMKAYNDEPSVANGKSDAATKGSAAGKNALLNAGYSAEQINAYLSRKG